jgi:hypothetical protein
MKRLVTVVIALACLAAAGCVVVPAHRYYVGPAVVVHPVSPVVVVP